VAGEGQKDELISLLGGDLAYQRTSQWLWPERNQGQFSPVLALPRAGRHKPYPGAEF